MRHQFSQADFTQAAPNINSLTSRPCPVNLPLLEGNNSRRGQGRSNESTEAACRDFGAGLILGAEAERADCGRGAAADRTDKVVRRDWVAAADRPAAARLGGGTGATSCGAVAERSGASGGGGSQRTALFVRPGQDTRSNLFFLRQQSVLLRLFFFTKFV